MDSQSPFIPPLHTPRGSPLPPPHPPVIPSPGGNLPGWGQTAQHSGSYPTYPHTPYTSTPFMPNLPAMTPGGSSGGHLPPLSGHPHYPPISAGPHYPPHLQHPSSQPQHQVNASGFSVDYTGYPQFGPSPFAGPSASLHPPTPYGPASAPLQNMGAPPWGPPAPPGRPYPPFAQPPQSAGPFPGAYPGAFAGAYPGGAYAAPQQPPGWGHTTPAHPMMNLDPWGAMQTPGWAAQQQAQLQAQQMHMMQSQQPPQIHLPQHLQTVGRASYHIGDRVDHFMAGNSYGPVLEPFLIRVVQAELKLNPLIEPIPENAGDRPHLKWNMLFNSNTCQRSTDPGHISWSNGRNAPATFPRVTYVQIVSESFPWMLKIRAENPNVGVTCGELIDHLSDEFHKFTSGSDYNSLPQQKKHQVGEAYRFNRSRALGVPGGRLGDGMRRLDYFCKDTIFGGISNDPAQLRRMIGVELPCTFILKCVRRYALTAEEVREHDARERAAEELQTERRRATVQTVTDSSTEDDDDD